MSRPVIVAVGEILWDLLPEGKQLGGAPGNFVHHALSLGADAALITSLVNVRYLTGLASSNAALLLPADGPVVLATDSRYALAAERDCPDVELLSVRPVETALAELAVARGLGRLAFEAQEMTVERHAALAAAEVIQHLGARPETSLKALARDKGFEL